MAQEYFKLQEAKETKEVESEAEKEEKDSATDGSANDTSKEEG